ncbi:hypothetical protein GGF44_005350, partial [Coemansia sp. RSA 1694]
AEPIEEEVAAEVAVSSPPSEAAIIELVDGSGKRDSLAQPLLSPGTQADMDRLAMAVNKLSV